MRKDERRIIAGPRNRNFDHYISDLLHQRGFGFQRIWHAVPDQQRADQIRRRLKTAGDHLGVSIKAFWTSVDGSCGVNASCKYHVYFSAYDPAVARVYKRRQLAARSQEHV